MQDFELWDEQGRSFGSGDNGRSSHVAFFYYTHVPDDPGREPRGALGASVLPSETYQMDALNEWTILAHEAPATLAPARDAADLSPGLPQAPWSREKP
jgi:hypothetical protein